MLNEYVMFLIHSIVNLVVASLLLHNSISYGVDSIMDKIVFISLLIIMMFSIFTTLVIGYEVITGM